MPAVGIALSRRQQHTALCRCADIIFEGLYFAVFVREGVLLIFPIDGGVMIPAHDTNRLACLLDAGAPDHQHILCRRIRRSEIIAAENVFHQDSSAFAAAGHGFHKAQTEPFLLASVPRRKVIRLAAGVVLCDVTAAEAQLIPELPFRIRLDALIKLHIAGAQNHDSR